MQTPSSSDRAAKALSALLFLSLLMTTGGQPVAAAQPDGAALFRKHCSLCHPDPSKIRVDGPLTEVIRTPLPGMPAFSEEKLSDTEVRALEEHIHRHSAPPPGSAVVRPVEGKREPGPATAGTATAGAVTAAPSGVDAHPRAKRSWNKALARSWTVKRLHDGDTATVGQFTVAANANNEPEVTLPERFSDYTVKVASFQASGRTLRLELIWGWKLNANYWKKETFELRLSDDRAKLNGSYSLRTSAGQSVDATVWAE